MRADQQDEAVATSSGSKGNIDDTDIIEANSNEEIYKGRGKRERLKIRASDPYD